MKSYRTLQESKKVLKRVRIDGYPVTYTQVGSKVTVQIDSTEVDTYPDLATAEKMATAFINNYKDLMH